MTFQILSVLCHQNVDLKKLEKAEAKLQGKKQKREDVGDTTTKLLLDWLVLCTFLPFASVHLSYALDV